MKELREFFAPEWQKHVSCQIFPNLNNLDLVRRGSTKSKKKQEDESFPEENLLSRFLVKKWHIAYNGLSSAKVELCTGCT